LTTRRTIQITVCTLATLTIGIAPAAAQQRTSQQRLDNCQHGWSSEGERFCEMRTVTLPTPAGTLAVDGRENGGVTVIGSDVSNIRVEALVQAMAASPREAEELAKQVRILTDGGRIRAEGPPSRSRSWWAVNYQITVPRRANLDLRSHNGGISIEDVTGQVKFATTNGGIHLANVDGDVSGETTNGGINVDLKGSNYRGAGLDVTTTNGAVTLNVPASYSARLETGTVNGRISTDIPFTVEGENVGHTLTATLGQGGALIHVATQNGGVRVRRSS
jgi:putative adhesin